MFDPLIFMFVVFIGVCILAIHRGCVIINLTSEIDDLKQTDSNRCEDITRISDLLDNELNKNSHLRSVLAENSYKRDKVIQDLRITNASLCDENRNMKNLVNELSHHLGAYKNGYLRTSQEISNLHGDIITLPLKDRIGYAIRGHKSKFVKAL